MASWPRWRQKAATLLASAGLPGAGCHPPPRRRDALRRAGARGARAATAGTAHAGQRPRAARGVRERIPPALWPARPAGGGGSDHLARRLVRAATRSAASTASEATGDAESARKGTRRAYVPEQGGMTDVAVYDRYRLGPGATLHWPRDRRGARIDDRHRPGGGGLGRWRRKSRQWRSRERMTAETIRKQTAVTGRRPSIR